ncbi:PDR/VanB family oxidoreductase [Bradyrhizobium quebecense]|uniref:Oxidoreductase n=2 Tax=Bradyrhizobium quebecense TaxID=2748629 RepID=A0ABS3MT91_9BRAD|nr:PDR/VanB family oxidoreductase [Bradyrhizobium quebecense]UGY02512.1 PDR/VanB family oxidoreductase [Bradyrhizobium quebecense]
MDDEPRPSGHLEQSAKLINATVLRRSRETADVALLEIVASEPEKLPPFTAGAHVDLHLPNGLVRQYSICNDPAEDDLYRFGVLMAGRSRGGSRAVHALKAGDMIRIGRPRNHFELVETAKNTLLIGGGIGVTPLMAMSYRLHSIGVPFEFIYCARSRLNAAFHKRLSTAQFAGSVHWCFDKPDGSTGFDLQRLSVPDADTHLYVCGPRGFIDYVVGFANAAGWPQSNIHTEAFEPSVASKDDKEFTVVAQRSGKTLKVRSDQTIAQALLEAGIAVTVSCEQGICGTCLVPILDGEPDHRDRYQSELEHATNSFVALCCSRSKSDALVLDI